MTAHGIDPGQREGAAPAFVVRRAQGSREMMALLKLRHDVFCVEQGVPPREEVDGRDGESIHLVAVGRDGTVLGVCRLLLIGATAQFSRLAVAPAARRIGIATALLREADAEARALGGRRLVLHAQTYAQRLYEQAGYSTRGRVFVEAGIEHISMEKVL
jgi:ElaA protein